MNRHVVLFVDDRFPPALVISPLKPMLFIELLRRRKLWPRLTNVSPPSLPNQEMKENCVIKWLDLEEMSYSKPFAVSRV